MIKNYEEILEFLRKDKSGKAFFSGIKSDELILKAEAILSLKFSPMYKKFLYEFGAGSYGATEILGITSDKFVDSCVPNGIWYTLNVRESSNLPLKLLIICEAGDGGLYCQDYNNISESEPNIVLYLPGVDDQYQTYEVIAKNFGDFLVDKLNFEIL